MTIPEMAKGNPGAFMCLMGLMQFDNVDPFDALTIMLKVESYGILGDDLYVLWNDLSGKRYDIMAHLCMKVPADVLRDACSRQDYSGRPIVQPYVIDFLTNNNPVKENESKHS